MDALRGPLASSFARQILTTCASFLSKPANELAVLDVGSGYGHTALALARQCKSVVGIEPNLPLWRSACALQQDAGQENLEFRHTGIYELDGSEQFDLIVLDNVLEHLPDQPLALRIISDCLAPAGAAYILVPNRLWPLEVHYGLPFLSYLPLSWANRYLRLSGRGTDYTDASYMPTYWRLNDLLMARRELSFQYVLPADIRLAAGGSAWHYRLGVRAIRRWPWLWAISKALLVVVRKRVH